MEKLSLERTSGGHLIQLFCQSRARLDAFAHHYDIIVFFHTHLLS